MITTSYYVVTTSILLHYLCNITQLLHMNTCYFVLLQNHYFMITTGYCVVATSTLLHELCNTTQLLHMNIRYFVLLQNHYFFITARYYIVTTPLCPDYCFITTILLNFNVHYFELLRGHYYIITTNYCRFTIITFLPNLEMGRRQDTRVTRIRVGPLCQLASVPTGLVASALVWEEAVPRTYPLPYPIVTHQPITHRVPGGPGSQG